MLVALLGRCFDPSRVACLFGSHIGFGFSVLEVWEEYLAKRRINKAKNEGKCPSHRGVSTSILQMYIQVKRQIETGCNRFLFSLRLHVSGLTPHLNWVPVTSSTGCNSITRPNVTPSPDGM